MIVLLLGGVSFNSHASEEYSPPVSIQKIIFTYTVKQDGSYQEVSEVSTLIENKSTIKSLAAKIKNNKSIFILYIQKVYII